MINWGGRKYIPANTVRNNRQNISERDRLEDLLKPLGEKKYNTNTWIANVYKESQSTPPFDPSSIGGLAIWLDASDASTLDLVGNKVQGWASKGLVPMTFSASTVARRPEYITTGGTGAFEAVKFFTASTAANRSGLMTETISGFSTNFGWSAFYIGKQIGLGSSNTYVNVVDIFNLWNTQNTGLYGSSLTTLGNRGVFDYMITGTTSQGFAASYVANSSLMSGYSIASPYFVQGAVLDYNNLSYNPNCPKTYNYITDKLRSIQTGYGLSTFSGKTWNKFGLASNARTGTEVVNLAQTLELYEVLFYNKILSQSEFDDVINYINSKYSIPAPDYSSAVKVSVNWIGKTGNTSDTNNVNIQSPTGTGNWQSIYGQINGTFLMNPNVQSYWNLNDSANVGFNYRMADSNGNEIFAAECGSDDIFYTFSAGTYTLSGQTNYNCPEPSPTPTPTMTITPTMTPSETPTPTPTPSQFFGYADAFFNLTGDATSRFALIQDNNSQVWFDISGVTTTGFTLNLPPESFTIIYENTAGNYMNFEGYPANCITGLPSGSPLYTNYCVSVNNQNWGMGYQCYYFNMFADQVSCP